ncbi:hypothetical protein T439DRAFT_378809 [Meredithblackwellia eburnea MCA 4105]
MRPQIVFAAFAALSVAASSSHQRFAHHRRTSTSSSYTIKHSLSGNDFIDFFTFAEGTNDNSGIAEYVSKSEAQSGDLYGVGTDNDIHLRVESTKTVTSTRKALKLTSSETFGVGDLIILDTARQPQVCGAWPAFWLTSATETWPAGGEIDVVEYVSLMTTATASVHTSSGCSMGTTGYTGTQMLSGSSGLNCDPNETDSQGCGIRSNKANSTGQGIGTTGGATYALEIASSGISVWVFREAEDEVPSDITSKEPVPSGWGEPFLFLSSSDCSPISDYFQNLMLIFNTNLCGTWAGDVWSDNLAYAGQYLSGSCATQTGYSTCEEYVLANGQDFVHAYWKIRSLNIYSSS